MSKRVLLLAFGLAFAQSAAFAQEHTEYTVAERVQMFGPASTMIVYRDGQRAVIDLKPEPSPGASAQPHVRSFYDLAQHTNFTWQVSDPSTCGSGRFSGDWGDPFASSVSMMADLNKDHAQLTGAETVNGFESKTYEASAEGAKIKAWVDGKSGAVVKAVMTPAQGPALTLVEVTRMTLEKPAEQEFAVPASCKPAGPPPPTPGETIASETGGKAEDYAQAFLPPAAESTTTCSVLVKMVKAGTLEQITSGFQIAVDTTYDVDHPPHYVTGVVDNGRATFSGGGIRELTAQLQNGTLRLDNVPKYFEIETRWANGGDSEALIYRQCFGAQTTLLFVMKDPANLGAGGDWLWVKGKR